MHNIGPFFFFLCVHVLYILVSGACASVKIIMPMYPGRQEVDVGIFPSLLSSFSFEIRSLSEPAVHKFG